MTDRQFGQVGAAPPVRLDRGRRGSIDQNGVFAPDRSPLSWILEREIVRFLRIWRHTIAGQVLTPLIMLIVFGFALSHKVGVPGGIPYKRFILPGLVAQAVMVTGYANGTTSLFDARRDRYINDVLASPLRWWETNVALVVASMLRGTIAACLVAMVGLTIVGGGIDRWPVLLSTMIPALLIAALIGIIAGVYVKTMDQTFSLQTLVVQPLAFLGGTFYSVATLPHAWRTVTYVNPVFYFVQGLRMSFLGRADISLGLDIAVLWWLALILSLWSLQLFRSGRRLKD
ncbi:MAG: ABC transporter permease [Solirubrobacteraceae bacterium]